jgi:hypothetical protein
MPFTEIIDVLRGNHTKHVNKLCGKNAKFCKLKVGGIEITYIKRYSNSYTGLDRPRVFQEAEAPRFQNNRHMKVVTLSFLLTGRLYPQEITVRR